MVKLAFRIFGPEGIAAYFTEPNQDGDELDINAPRNAPAKFPEQYLNKIRFHSHLDHMEVEFAGTRTINHDATSSGSDIPIADNTTKKEDFSWRKNTKTHNIKDHNLGYEPFALIAVGGNVLWPGVPVQTSGDNNRHVSPYVTTSKLRIHEWSSVVGGLNAKSKTYQYIIFREQRSASGSKVFHVNASSGLVTMAHNRFRSDRAYLQIVAGGSPLGISKGKSIDLKNGAVRAIRADGTVFDPVPAGLKLGLVQFAGINTVFGNSMKYTGSFSDQGSVQVQAP